MEKQKGLKLVPDWDPTWPEDFLILKKISKTAFILWRLFISFRDPKTNICDLSDTEIQLITSFNRQTIKKAREKLISHVLIIPNGYHTYFIPNSKKFSTTWTESVQVSEKQMNKKHSTSWTKIVHHLDKNCPSLGQKVSNTINTDSDTDITDGKNSASPVENFNETARIDDSELPSLRSLYPFENREDLKRHLMATRGFSEKQVSDTFERVYPLQYTGKAR